MSRGGYLQHKNHNSQSVGVMERLVGFVAPHDCLFCGREGVLACAWCLPGVIMPVPARCYKCMSLTVDSALCKKCRRVSSLGRVWVATEFTGSAKKLVHSLKFQRARAAATPMANIMVECLPLLPQHLIVTHVPTATSRIRLRGYDQARLLAKQIARTRNHSYSPLFSRLGQTRQVGARREDRIVQMQAAFRIKNISKVSGAHILLVDDVTTTGATIEAAAKLLKQAGAKQVDAVLFAQKQ